MKKDLSSFGWGGFMGDRSNAQRALMVTAPTLDTFFGLDRKIGEQIAAGVEMLQSGMKYQATMAQAAGGLWFDFYEAWLSDPAEEARETAETPRQRLERSLSNVNESMLELQDSPKFLSAQAEVLGAVTKLREKTREVVESLQLAGSVPTRTEVDDLSRTIQALKRELRLLQRELADERSKSKRDAVAAKPLTASSALHEAAREAPTPDIASTHASREVPLNGSPEETREASREERKVA